MKCVLIIDDEPKLISAVSRLLQSKYKILSASTPEAGLQAAVRNLPDVILLDLHFSGSEGIACRSKLRTHLETREIPIILLSGNPAVEVRVECLLAGADDFLCKPFNCSELEARIHAQLRRRERTHGNKSAFQVGNLRLDPNSFEAFIEQNPLSLTALEFKILFYFASHANELVQRKKILVDLWPDSVVSGRTVDTHVAKLRRKIDGFSGALETVYGGGYKLATELSGAQEGKR